MAHTRCALVLAFALPLVARAAPGLAASTPECPEQRVDLPAVCVGESATGTSRFCFAPELGCLGTGVVASFAPPAPPFALVGLHLERLLETVPVGAADFPLTLAPGDVLVAEVSAVPTAEGETHGKLAWIPDTGKRCDVDLRVVTPTCSADLGECAADTCVGGACVPAPIDGACDDGNRCTVGDRCKDGVCTAGPPPDCADANPCTDDVCDPALGCVHVPYDARCDDGDPCTADTCDAVLGCVHTPRDGDRCDDGDGCTIDDTCKAGHCVGRPLTCDDKIPCTEDRCVDGACTHRAVDSRCDGGGCTRGTCAPGPRADRRGCVSTPVDEGKACTDDGHACTDDVCKAGVCLHVPMDKSCAPPGECRAAVCAPTRLDADATTGCVDEGDPGEGGVCTDDGDPCSIDRCRAGVCEHQLASDWDTCHPLDESYRLALGLAMLARDLAVEAGGAAGTAVAGARVPSALAVRLDRVTTALDGAVAALEGGGGVAPATLAPAALDAEPLAAQVAADDRAHIAFTRVLRTPAEVRSFLTLVTTAQARAALGADQTQTLRRRGRALLRGTRRLRGQLRRFPGG